MTLLLEIMSPFHKPFSVKAVCGENLLNGTQSTFENSSVPLGWSAFAGGTLSISNTVAYSGERSLKIDARGYSWVSPQYNIYSLIKANGAGTYKISFWVYVSALGTNPGNGRIVVRGTTNDQYTFFQSGQSFAPLSSNIPTRSNQWTQYTGVLNVINTDDLSGATGEFNLMIDSLEYVSGQVVYFDEVQIVKSTDNMLGGAIGTFEQDTVPTGWSVLGSGTLSTSSTVAHSGSKSLKLIGKATGWSSPAYNIYDNLKAGGAGTYFVSLWARVDALNTSPEYPKLIVRGTAAEDNSFINPMSCNVCPETSYYADLSGPVTMPVNTWTQFSGIITVRASDIASATGTFNLCLDAIVAGTNQNLYIDDVQLVKPATTVEKGENTEISFTSYYANTELISGNSSAFEDGGLNGWGAVCGGILQNSTTVAHSGNRSLKISNRPNSYSTQSINIYDRIRNNGAGTYDVSLWVYVDNLTTSPSNGRLIIRSDFNGQYSFIPSNQNWTLISSTNVSTAVNTWVQYKGTFTVASADISSPIGNFTLMIDGLAGNFALQNLYIDDVKIHETYRNPTNDVDMNVTFFGPNNTTIVLPATYNGSNTFKISFAPLSVGIWNYSTVCSNSADTGLDGQTGVIGCVTSNLLPLLEDVVVSCGLMNTNNFQKWMVEYTGATISINSKTEQIVNIKNKASGLYLTRKSNGYDLFVTEKTNANSQEWVMVSNGGNLLVSPVDDLTKYLNIGTSITLSNDLSYVTFAYPLSNNIETTISAGENYLQSGIIVKFGSLSITGSYIHNFTPTNDFKVNGIKSRIEFGKFTNYALKNGANTLLDTDTAGTGTTLEITYPVTATYTIIVYGDVSGDGNLTIEDLSKIKRDLLKIQTLSSIYKVAGDVNRNNFISISDLIKIKKAILGIDTINQS